MRAVAVRRAVWLSAFSGTVCRGPQVLPTRPVAVGIVGRDGPVDLADWVRRGLELLVGLFVHPRGWS